LVRFSIVLSLELLDEASPHFHLHHYLSLKGFLTWIFVCVDDIEVKVYELYQAASCHMHMICITPL